MTKIKSGCEGHFSRNICYNNTGKTKNHKSRYQKCGEQDKGDDLGREILCGQKEHFETTKIRLQKKLQNKVNDIKKSPLAIELQGIALISAMSHRFIN